MKQLSMNLGTAVSLWAGAAITGFYHRTEASLMHFLPQGTPIPFIPMPVIVETISLFVQSIALAMWLTANTMATHLLIHPIQGKALALIRFHSVQFSRSVGSDSLRPHELQHARTPCPSPTPGVYSNPCPSSQWCHPTISSSVIPFSSCPQSFPASGSFQMSRLFASGGQSIGVSASTLVLPMNIHDCSPLGCTGWTSLQSKGLSRVFSNTTVQKHQFFSAQLSL